MRPLVGATHVPGDKSCTHRALLLGAFAEGTTHVRGALVAADTLSSARVVSALGAAVRWDDADASTLRDAHGAHDARGTRPGGDVRASALSIVGVDAPRIPYASLDCGNAGTLARLLVGLLAGHVGRWTLDGDASLRSRPMGRVARPLAALGADVRGERLPLEVRGARLRGGDVTIDTPSAQVASAVLLAGLRADGPVTVRQSPATRDHTERMLPLFGVPVERRPGAVTVQPARPRAARLDIPGDPSSAAFLAVAALLVPGSDLVLRDVGLWPRRTGFLRALERADAAITVLARRGTGDEAGDPRGDLRVAASSLRAFSIAAEDVPDLVDEVPVLAVAASLARGTSRFAGLAELRVKESDRVTAIADLLRPLGVPVTRDGDTLCITGVDRLRGPPPDVDHADHRMALAAAVARLSMGLPLPATLPAADISFPGFAAVIEGLRGSVR